MNKRVNISSGASWEEKVGYSRVVKVDNHIFVTGTVAVDDDGEIIGDTAFEQTDFIISKIEKFLNKVDATLKDVVRTRIFVTNIDDWEEIGKAHHKYFKSIKPATTMVEVSRLIGKNLLLEIEADAIIS